MLAIEQPNVTFTLLHSDVYSGKRPFSPIQMYRLYNVYMQIHVNVDIYMYYGGKKPGEFPIYYM
jgi:hypothetical protein